MSIHVMKSVWDCRLPESISKNRRSTVKLVLLKLADNSNDNGKCWPSMERIAHETDMSERSVVRCIAELESCNIIKRETRWVDRKKHNTYFINIPLLNAIARPYKKEQSITENDNPFMTSDSLSNVEDSLSKVDDSLSVKPSVNHQNNHNHKHKHSSDSQKERRLFIDELCKEDFPYCIEAMKSIKKFKEQLGNENNFYDGSMTMEQWSRSEDKLQVTCSSPAEADELLYNIYTSRKLGGRKSVSLDYMLFGEMDADEFSHIAINCESWL